jgi:hypothetical protein
MAGKVLLCWYAYQETLKNETEEDWECYGKKNEGKLETGTDRTVLLNILHGGGRFLGTS